MIAEAYSTTARKRIDPRGQLGRRGLLHAVILACLFHAGWACAPTRHVSLEGLDDAPPNAPTEQSDGDVSPVQIQGAGLIEDAEQKATQTSPAATAHFLAARKAQDAGDFREAVNHLRLAIVIDPRQPRLHRDLSRLLVRLDRPDESLREAGIALELDLNDEASRSWLETVKLLHGLVGTISDREGLEPPEFTDETKRRIAARLAYSNVALVAYLNKSTRRSESTALAESAWMLALVGQEGAARILAQGSLAQTPRALSETLRVALALADLPLAAPLEALTPETPRSRIFRHLQNNQADDLLLALEALATKDEKNRLRFLVATLLVENNRPALAQAVLGENDTLSDNETLRLRAQATLGLGNVAKAQSLLERVAPLTQGEALEREMLLSALSKRLPGAPPAPPKTAWLSTEHGKSPCAVLTTFPSFAQSGAENFSFLEQATRVYPDDPACLLALALLEQQRNRPDAAKARLDEAVGRFPHDAAPFLARGLSILSRQGAVPEARTDLQTAALLTELSPKSLAALALYHEKSWNPRLAWYLFTLAAAQAPHDPALRRVIHAFLKRQAKHPDLAGITANAQRWANEPSTDPTSLGDMFLWPNRCDGSLFFSLYF